jgi:exosortase/archaeosortase family protein
MLSAARAAGLSSRVIFAGAIVLAGMAILYRDVVPELIHAWSTDDNYSHGYLIPPIAAYLAWERRQLFLSAPIHPSAFGLIVILGSVLVLALGVLGIELFLTRISLLGVFGGTLLFLFGWPRLRVMLFPLAFLILMIPLPAIIFNQIAFPLQLIASQFGEVLANITLEVAEACSGIRSLISLLTLGIVFGYIGDARTWVRVLIAVSTVPVAVISNGARVAGTGIAAHYYGSAAAEGFLHEFSGWLVFVTAFAMMVLLYRVLRFIAPDRKDSADSSVAVSAA